MPALPFRITRHFELAAPPGPHAPDLRVRFERRTAHLRLGPLRLTAAHLSPVAVQTGSGAALRTHRIPPARDRRLALAQRALALATLAAFLAPPLARARAARRRR